MDKLLIFVALDDIRERSIMLGLIEDPKELKYAVNEFIEFASYRIDKICKNLTYPKKREKLLMKRINELKNMMQEVKANEK